MDLLEQWTATLQRLTAAPDRGLGRALLDRYAEPHRHYHNTDHLQAVLAAIEVLAPHAVQPDVVRLAAWYHDAIYDPHRADNEQRSADLAEHDLPMLGLRPETTSEVASLVRMTQTHEPAAGDGDAEVLSDADLAVLGLGRQEYDEYVARVRLEYRHLTAEEWRTGRAHLVRSLLDRSRLFRTPTGQEWEPGARANLNRELTELVAPSGGATPRQ